MSSKNFAAFGDLETVLTEYANGIKSKADLAELADAFSASQSYAVGSYVTYNGDLYRCTTEHSAGAWNSAHFTAVSVGGELTGKANKSEMSVTAGTGANADKTTIQLKSGTSATVLTQHQDVSGKADASDVLFKNNYVGTGTNVSSSNCYYFTGASVKYVKLGTLIDASGSQWYARLEVVAGNFASKMANYTVSFYNVGGNLKAEIITDRNGTSPAAVFYYDATSKEVWTYLNSYMCIWVKSYGRIEVPATASTSDSNPCDTEITTIIDVPAKLSTKADKVSGATANNFVSLDSNGNLQDSGKKARDFQNSSLSSAMRINGANRSTVEEALTGLNSIADFRQQGSSETGSADLNDFIETAKTTRFYAYNPLNKPSDVTGWVWVETTGFRDNGYGKQTLCILSDTPRIYCRGYYTRSGSTFWGNWTQVQTAVSGATSGNLASLDANGNLADSGKKAADFAQVTTTTTDPGEGSTLGTNNLLIVYE